MADLAVIDGSWHSEPLPEAAATEHMLALERVLQDLLVAAVHCSEAGFEAGFDS